MARDTTPKANPKILGQGRPEPTLHSVEQKQHDSDDRGGGWPVGDPQLPGEQEGRHTVERHEERDADNQVVPCHREQRREETDE